MCRFYPMLNDDELEKLGADIKQNGLRHRIVLWQPHGDSRTFVLDGRNRLEAMERAGLELNEIYLDRIAPDGPVDPASLVIGLNVHRRHLTKEQQAVLIVRTLDAATSTDRATVARSVTRGLTDA
jgi:ParB-like chromosome segregation protein Spo0J